jgi:hypothetical protein
VPFLQMIARCIIPSQKYFWNICWNLHILHSEIWGLSNLEPFRLRDVLTSKNLGMFWRVDFTTYGLLTCGCSNQQVKLTYFEAIRFWIK